MRPTKDDNHGMQFCNVLYLDGHAVPLKGKADVDDTVASKRLKILSFTD